MKKLACLISVIAVLLYTTSCQKDIDITPRAQDSIPPVTTTDSLLWKIIGKNKAGIDSSIVTFLYNSSRQVVERKDEELVNGVMTTGFHTLITRDASGKITRVLFQEYPVAPDTTWITYLPNSSMVAYELGNDHNNYKDSTAYVYMNNMVKSKKIYTFDSASLSWQLYGIETYQYDVSGNMTSYVDSNRVTMETFNYAYDSHKGMINMTNTENHILSPGFSQFSKNNVIRETAITNSGTNTRDYIYSYNSSDKPKTATYIEGTPADTLAFRFIYKN